MKKIQSTCNYCSLACGLDFYVKDKQIVNVVPNKEFPVNKGKACIKGLNLDKQSKVITADPFPKINQEKKTWDEAYNYVASELLRIKEKYGPDAIAGISTGQMPLEEMALIGHVMRNELKANLDGNTRLCMATSVVAYKQSFGFDAPPYTLNDAELSDTIILIGANPVVAHPVLWGRIKHSKVENKKVIVIDPRKSETAEVADYYYNVKTKTDNILMYTIANELITNDYIDKKFIDEHVNNFEEFKTFVADYTLDKVEDATGLKKEEVSEIVELINKGKNVSFWWTMGINQSYDAVRTAQSIINLALITGNIGRKGTGANSITGQCNAMGSRAFSHQAGLFGGGDFTNEKRRKQICEALNISDSYLIDKPTIPYNAIIEGINKGEIKALWIMCTNPRHSWINNETFKEAISKLELFVVQDVYDDTDSALLADVFLPVVPGIKKSGTLINTERRLSPLRPILPLEENEKTDFEVFYNIGKALNMGDNLKGWETPESVFELMKKCSENMPVDISGVNYEDLDNSKGIQWPYPKGSKDLITNEDNERRLFSDFNFYTPDKRANLMFDEPLKNPLPIDEEYDFVLNTGRGTVGQWHTQVRSREIVEVNEATHKKAYLLMNPKDAQNLNVKHLDSIEVSSINGQVSIFDVHVTDNVNPKELFAPMHYIETNRLSVSVYDRFSKEPSYKYAPVKVRKLEENNEAN